MAHPTQLLEELQKSMPEVMVQQWVYGLFNTTRSDISSGLKGILSVTDNHVIFWSGSKDEQSAAYIVPCEHIESSTFSAKGPTNITCNLADGTYMEMSFISRGNPEEFFACLELFCKNKADNPL